jgi:hypothetical protein
MTQFYKGSDSIGIGWNLIQLSLDAVVPAYDLIKAPELPLSDLVRFRDWILRGPPLDCFAFGSDGYDFAAYASDLERTLSPGRGSALLDWAVFTSSMSDPSPQSRKKDWPDDACAAWLAAFDDAKSLGVLNLLDIEPAKITRLSEFITQRQTRQSAADAFTVTVKKEWDPFPLNPAQLAYNRKVKSAWDQKIYEEFCRPNSASLDFAILFMVDHQEARTFVTNYAAQLDPQDHATIRRDLPNLLAGKGLYATDARRLARLDPYRDHSPETLVQFAGSSA